MCSTWVVTVLCETERVPPRCARSASLDEQTEDLEFATGQAERLPGRAGRSAPPAKQDIRARSGLRARQRCPP
jgi:hypothetical protein